LRRAPHLNGQENRSMGLKTRVRAPVFHPVIRLFFSCYLRANSAAHGQSCSRRKKREISTNELL
jgi:hypothetical protein